MADKPEDGAGEAQHPPKADGSRSVYDLEELDVCPACGKALPGDATVCVACGYDLRENRKRSTETVVEESPSPDPSKEPFVLPDRGGVQAPLIGGVVALIGAMVAAGATAGQVTAGTVIAIVLLKAYLVVVHTATGVGAVLVAAKLAEQRFGTLEVAAARMFLAFGLFALIHEIPIPLAYVGGALAWLAAMGVYWLTVLLMFGRGPRSTTIIATSHLVLWALVELGQFLAAVAAGSGEAGTAG